MVDESRFCNFGKNNCYSNYESTIIKNLRNTRTSDVSSYKTDRIKKSYTVHSSKYFNLYIRNYACYNSYDFVN